MPVHLTRHHRHRAAMNSDQLSVRCSCIQLGKEPIGETGNKPPNPLQLPAQDGKTRSRGLGCNCDQYTLFHLANPIEKVTPQARMQTIKIRQSQSPKCQKEQRQMIAQNGDASVVEITSSMVISAIHHCQQKHFPLPCLGGEQFTSSRLSTRYVWKGLQ